MTGHLLVKSKKLKVRSKKKDFFSDRVNQYIHHIWHLGKNKTMEFSDVRKFAKIVLDKKEKIAELKEIKALGIDALDEKFTLEKFQEILEKRKHISIGLVLMDQERISGIGNIYRSEILFEAGILPTRLVKNIKKAERKKLYAAIQKVLKKAIKLRGTSDSDYRDTAGVPGNFQKALRVYRRGGKRCPECGTIVLRSKMGQRSVFFCPKCQK
jgi:formamidopyrimidine-DNA glycosylase